MGGDGENVLANLKGGGGLNVWHLCFRNTEGSCNKFTSCHFERGGGITSFNLS